MLLFGAEFLLQLEAQNVMSVVAVDVSTAALPERRWIS